MLTNLGLRQRLRGAGLHLLISGAVATLAAALVFGVWYPGPFRLLAGGQGLFLLVTSVDVVLGPVLTFAVFNVAKGRGQLRLDLAVIGLIQMAGLSYGLHTVHVVRPVAMVFEVDRFQLVTANDVVTEELSKALPEYRQLPTTGPLLLGTRAPRPGAEHNDVLLKGLAGSDLASRPLFWQPYELSRAAAILRARPIALLIEHYRRQTVDVRDRLKEMQADESTARFLPAMARGDWVAVLDARGQVLGYLPVDGFF